MVAKLVIFGLMLMAVLSVLLIMLYRYLDNAAERQHEKELRKMEQTDRIMEETSIDSQLERERER